MTYSVKAYLIFLAVVSVLFMGYGAFLHHTNLNIPAILHFVVAMSFIFPAKLISNYVAGTWLRTEAAELGGKLQQRTRDMAEWILENAGERLDETVSGEYFDAVVTAMHTHLAEAQLQIDELRQRLDEYAIQQKTSQ